jgi:thiazole/oxazole-forming peptide maturase SagD family component
MKKSKILGLNPKVIFRPSRALSVPSRTKTGIHVKNLTDGAIYEFTGRAACLWLLINGSRTEEQIIRKCMKLRKIKNLKFQNSARKFLSDLLDVGLVVELQKVHKDNRASDMQFFLKMVNRLADKPLSSEAGKKKNFEQPGDRTRVALVKKAFSKIKKIAIKSSRSVKVSMNGNFHIFNSEVTLSDKSKHVGSGAGFEIQSAIGSAIGEALERAYSFGRRPDIFAKSFDQLKDQKNILDPNSYHLFYEGQVALKNLEISNYKRSSKIDWSLFEDGFSKTRKIFIPAEFNGCPPSKESQTFVEGTSSGCASAFDPDTAKVRGILELIERDALLFYWRTQNSPKLIELQRLNDRLKTLVKFVDKELSKIKLFYLKTDLKPITVQAVFLGNRKKDEPFFVSTCATRMDVTDAIEKAVIELLYVVEGLKASGSQARIFYGKNFDNSIWEFGDRSLLYSWFKAKDAYSFLFPRTPQRILWSNIKSCGESNSKDALKSLIADFKKNGIRLYFRNNTPSEISRSKFWVFRAFSPDLLQIEGVHRNRQLGHPRQYNLSKKLGLQCQPKDARQLNSWPHPLP